MTRGAPEQYLHQTIAVFLSRALPAGAWHTALDSAGKASYVIAARLKARGGQRGIPDAMILLRGYPAIFLEVKAPNGVLSPSQRAVASCIKLNGHHWFEVRSVEDVEFALRDLGIPLRATVAGIRASIAAQNEGLKPIRKRASRPRQARATPQQVARMRSSGVLV